jgi:hypothetical protein
MTPDERYTLWMKTIIAILVIATWSFVLVVRYEAKAYHIQETEIKEVCRTEFGQHRPCGEYDTRVKHYD